MKKVNISVNRKDKKGTKLIEEESVVETAKDLETESIEQMTEPEEKSSEQTTLSGEDLYAKEMEKVLDAYIEFAQTYKQISKKLLNPIKMRKQAGVIYQQLSKLSSNFNQVITQFKEKAVVPTEDLQPIHDKLLESLAYFEVYNTEFPTLMRSGNFKRINEVSKGLDKGHKGIKEVFAALEEREANKDKE